MGTRGGGITRFDGINFKSYSIKDGLANNYIFTIKEDASGNLWIGTNNGLSKYNGISFKSYHPASDTTQVWIQDICFDEKGCKLLATNIGLILFDNNSFTNISEIIHEPRDLVTAILKDKKGNIWYGNSNGLFKINTEKQKYTLEKNGKNKSWLKASVTSIKEDANGNIWIGTYGDGVYFSEGNSFTRLSESPEITRQTILDIYYTDNENIWLATLTGGVVLFNKVANTFSSLKESEGLGNNHVRCIIRDKSGNFWFGTSGGGICHYFGKQFTHYDKSSGLGGNFIYSILKDSKNRLWVANSDKGISVRDSLGFVNYSSLNGFADVKVRAICEDKFGNIYFGTDGDGVFVTDTAGFKSIPELSKKYIRAMINDKDGNLWIAGAGMGIYKLNLKPDTFYIQKFTEQNGLLSNRITCLLYDKQGRLWYGTESSGIGFIFNDTLQPKLFTVSTGLSSNNIRSLTEDESGYLWIGTAGSGIASFPLYEGDYKIQNFDHSDGLTSTNVYLLTTDKNNNLFVGTESGLDYITLNSLRNITQIKHYGKGEGFIGIETCQNSVFNEPDGTIWFGTINGLTKYNPANRVKNIHEPITNITDIKLFYKSIADSEYKHFAGDWNKVKLQELPYDQNHLTFDFNAINFSNPDAVKYQWKLEGFDENWSPVSKEQSILYSNLGSGKYTFLVKACNEDGVWNSEPVRISFSIMAPVWLRWWFIALELLVFSGLVIGVFRWRVNRIRFKASEEQKKLKMEKEIVELEQKALRLQMNPHFIFNALNSIQSQIGTNNDKAARYYLAKFSRLMRQILDNSRNTFITLEEEVNTLENYLLIEKFCNDDRFDYTITLDENIEKDYIKIPPMLLQPFVENSIKHGLKYLDGKRGCIEVNFTEKDNLLECSVSDNGIGRVKSAELNRSSKETYHQSTALIVTQDRLSMIHSDKVLKSLEIIDLYDDFEKAEGTKIIVRIPVD